MTMEVSATICVCAMALLFQSVSSVCIDPRYDRIAPWARTFLAWRKANTNVAGSSVPLLRNIPRYSTWLDDIPLPAACYPAGLVSSGGLAVTTASQGPIGISVLSDNIIQGPLAVAGELPFLGSVALGGTLPTSGSGSVSYGPDGVNGALLAAKAPFGFNRYVE